MTQSELQQERYQPCSNRSIQLLHNFNGFHDNNYTSNIDNIERSDCLEYHRL